MRLPKTAAIAALLSLTAAEASAATVASAATRAGDVDGIKAVGGTSVYALSGIFDMSRTARTSRWVWIDDPFAIDDAVYRFTFDLAGFDLSTAALSGLWAVDNIGFVSLNGTEIGALATLSRSNFTQLHYYGATSGFVAGVNTLTFQLFDNEPGGGQSQAAFRATARVTADPLSLTSRAAPPVLVTPLPGGLALILAALGALLGLRRLQG